MKHYIHILLAAALTLAAAVSCTKPGTESDQQATNKFIGNYSYTETLSVTIGKDTSPETKTGTLTITSPSDGKLHLTAPFAVDARIVSGGLQFQCDKVYVQNDDNDMEYEFTLGYLDNDGKTLNLGYVGTGKKKVDGKMTTCRVVSIIVGTKR